MAKMEVDTYDLHRLVLLLDAAQEALNAAAVAEMRRERGKAMRSITDQQRAETARTLVAEMIEKYGVDV